MLKNKYEIIHEIIYNTLELDIKENKNNETFFNINYIINLKELMPYLNKLDIKTLKQINKNILEQLEG